MGKIIRIGFDAKRYFHNRTGLGNYSRWLINGLSLHQELESHLYTPSNISGASNNLTVHESGKSLRIFQDRWRNKTIVKDLLKDGIDCFHGLSNEIPFGIHKTEIKTIVTIHDCIQKRYPEQYSRIDRAIYNKKVQYAQRYADLIVTPSKQTKDDLMKFFGTEAGKIRVIPIGTGVIDSIDESNPKKESEPYILCVSSFTERKNLVRLAQAFFKSTIKNTKLIIAGSSGPVYPRLKRMAEKNPNLILYLSPSDQELNTLYSNALFTVYPSVFEGFGIPILESFLHSKAVVCSNRSSLPEVAGSAAEYFNPEDTEDIKKALENLSFSEKHRMHLESLIPSELERFSDKHIISEYAHLYKSLF